ncbi:MAG: EutN/CcmL family microcompartment protein [Clostridiales Family XIII bacterium]|jgi:ethanolamine utilization protein EutN|nr:EutN/CcmL family microcompartment protein [Clostridiales Family XIII bacterium]
MRLGTVIGSVWSTRKNDKLTGIKLLIIRPINICNKDEKICPIIAADQIGAGIGETVLMVGGSSARMLFGDQQTPIDTAVIGIVDDKELDDKPTEL